MQVLPRTVGDATILQLNGPLMLDTDYQAVTMLRRSIDAVGDRGRGSLILDLTNVSAMDALGLGELIRAYKAVQARGGTLKLLRPNTRVERLLSVTRIDSVIDVCYSDEEALDDLDCSQADREHDRMRDKEPGLRLRLSL